MRRRATAARAAESDLYHDPTVLFELATEAGSAAALLRSLAGYVEGLIEAVVLEQRITMEQVEAARQPAGFR